MNKDSNLVKRKELRDLLMSSSKLPDLDAALEAVRSRKELEKLKYLRRD